jgi:pyridoxal phosphate enzyme (YggS family)
LSSKNSAARLKDVLQSITTAYQESFREDGAPKLIAVSKTFEAQDILPVLEAGQRVFGENRVQEAAGKWPELREKYSDIELHLIGPLQSNKAENAVALFDVMHSVDREKIAKALSKEEQKQNKKLRYYIQVNTGEEPQKAGCIPSETLDFVKICCDVYRLDVIGLMCIPPVDDNPALHFALLKKLADEAGLARLSMGMSGDYDVAIRHGATDVRIGSAIFGSR